MQDRKVITIEKISGSQRIPREDVVVREAALTLYLDERELVTLICSPTHLRELCLGFLFSEGIIRSAAEVVHFSVNEKDGLAWVQTARPSADAGAGLLKRHIASCCGRGRASFYFVNDAGIEPVVTDPRFSAGDIFNLRARAEELGGLFAATGGAHGAALADASGVQAFFEDVGRHNTLDKLAGWCLLNRVSTGNKLILFSGRVSSEIVVKAARLGVPVLVSRSAPTDLALELADQLNVTVAGFARGERMNVYTRGERIL